MTTEKKEKGAGLLSLLIITIILYRGVGVIFYAFISELLKKQNEATQVMIYSVCVAITMAIAIPILLRKRNMLYLSTEAGFIKTVSIIVMGIVGSIAISGLFTSASDVFNIHGIFASETATNTPGAGSNILLQILGEGIAPAISEELVFRWVIFSVARKRYSFVESAFIVSFIFGVSHGISLLTFITFAGGFFLCYIYEKTRNIFVPVIIHGSYNTIGVTAKHLVDKTSGNILQLNRTENLILMLISVFIIWLAVFVIQKISKGNMKGEKA